LEICPINTLANGVQYNLWQGHKKNHGMDLKNEPSSHASDETHAILYGYLESIRPPEHIRGKLDIGYTYDGGVVEFFEIRPDWKDPSIIRHHPYSKIRFVKASNLWKLYWRRASGKWESYKPFPESSDLQALLDCIRADAYGCFYG